MSTAANVSAPRTASATGNPQLSKRTLHELKKGASVEVCFKCKPFKTTVAGVEKVEDQQILCSIPTALIRHFSRKCARELAANDSKRVPVPFAKTPTQLVVGWMMAGGGPKLGTTDVLYPKTELTNLGILKNLAKFLEIDSLVELIEKDIATVPPALPAVPTASSVPNASEKKAAPDQRICYYCKKLGHIQRFCPERGALFVNKAQGPTFSLRGTAPATAASGGGGSAEPASPKPVSNRQKLIPISGKIIAKDSSGWFYKLDWKHIEMEIDWPVTGGFCKFSGTAELDSW